MQQHRAKRRGSDEFALLVSMLAIKVMSHERQRPQRLHASQRHAADDVPSRSPGLLASKIRLSLSHANQGAPTSARCNRRPCMRRLRLCLRT